MNIFREAITETYCRYCLNSRSFFVLGFSDDLHVWSRTHTSSLELKLSSLRCPESLAKQRSAFDKCFWNAKARTSYMYPRTCIKKSLRSPCVARVINYTTQSIQGIHYVHVITLLNNILRAFDDWIVILLRIAQILSIVFQHVG